MPNQEYKERGERVGKGAMWIKEGKNGKFLSGQMEFSYNGHQVTARFISFKNNRKEPGSRQPDYNIFVDDAFPAKPRETRPPEPERARDEDDSQIPF